MLGSHIGALFKNCRKRKPVFQMKWRKKRSLVDLTEKQEVNMQILSGKLQVGMRAWMKF